MLTHSFLQDSYDGNNTKLLMAMKCIGLAKINEHKAMQVNVNGGNNQILPNAGSVRQEIKG